MENIKRVLSYTRRAVDDYEMIRDGDKIAVGVSAGKDSLTLLCALAALKRFYPKKFELKAITLSAIVAIITYDNKISSLLLIISSI